MCAPLGRLLAFEKSRHPRVKILSMQKDLYHILNRYEYKGGALKDLTNAYTSPLELLSVLLASDLVTEDEKTKGLRPWKNAIIEYNNMDISCMSAEEIRRPFKDGHEWAEFFRADLRSSAHNDYRRRRWPLLNAGRTLKQRPRMPRQFTREEALHMEHVRNIRRESPGTSFLTFDQFAVIDELERQRDSWLAAHDLGGEQATDNPSASKDKVAKNAGKKENRIGGDEPASLSGHASEKSKSNSRDGKESLDGDMATEKETTGDFVAAFCRALKGKSNAFL